MKISSVIILYVYSPSFLGAAQKYPPPDYSPPIYDSSYCEINDDEYGRPYYSPYDNYRPPYSTYGPYDRSTATLSLKQEPPTYVSVPGHGKRQKTLVYPACVRANECQQKTGTNICITNPFKKFLLQKVAMDMV